LARISCTPDSLSSLAEVEQRRFNSIESKFSGAYLARGPLRSDEEAAKRPNWRESRASILRMEGSSLSVSTLLRPEAGSCISSSSFRSNVYSIVVELSRNIYRPILSYRNSPSATLQRLTHPNWLSDLADHCHYLSAISFEPKLHRRNSN